MHKDDKKYFSRSDYLLGNIDPALDPFDPANPDYLYKSSYTPAPTPEPIKVAPKTVNKKVIPKTKPKAIPRTTLVPGKPGEYSMAEPGQKLKELKDTIRKANIKPTTAQKELYFELSEEIERRGESYLQKLEELYNPKGETHEYRQNNSNKIKGKKIIPG